MQPRLHANVCASPFRESVSRAKFGVASFAARRSNVMSQIAESASRRMHACAQN